MGNRKSKSSKRKSSEVIRSKKSRKSKKKLSRRRHSISSCSDDDSVSSISFYSSSSDEDYRSRKSHSLSRADVKSKKKRAERRASSKRKKRDEKGVSSNQESNEDCKPSRKRKKSRSKKRTEHERPQKKQRRDSSISSATSDSLSCSSCEFEHSSSKEIEFGRRSGKKIRDRRNPDVHKVEAKESGSKSANSLSTGDHSNFHNASPMGEEPAADSLNNARRIRSVITVIEHPLEEEEENLSKINDVGNGARENTFACHSDAVIDTSNAVQKITDNEGFDDVIGEPTSRGKSVANQCVNQDGSSNLGDSEKVFGVSDSVVFVNATTSGSEDLELILRQKALENLRKFRGKIQGVPIKSENVSNMLLKEEGSKAIKVTSAVGQSSNSGLSKEIMQPKMAENYTKVESRVTRQSHIQKPDGYALCKNVSRKDHINATPAIHEKSKTSEQASSNEAPLDGKDRSCKNIPELSNATNSAMAKPTSSVRTLEERSSNDQAEAKDGEQFQQKTMSVMRSGEMVQVSYKVYIPKRAPALSRRQLKQ
ncbi:hypothetical protein DM860_015110 [Cuscuta australis]|uniref:Uncharacterized protein n=1 Tax=Cuscuta australis TaxID=267555 RepID=A0A328DXN3_9ASTE|nr:hypothetical protein DM860_015110 [Cuscuta australis]